MSGVTHGQVHALIATNSEDSYVLNYYSLTGTVIIYISEVLTIYHFHFIQSINIHLNFPIFFVCKSELANWDNEVVNCLSSASETEQTGIFC